ncbi:MAG: septum formation inhibitor Maf [Halanaerobiales bacterium]|nr:septum formation inhibitor Maf [Halanaerobiales bacterium]
MKNGKVILASSSDRRKKLLNRIGIKYTAMPSKLNENNYNFDNPIELVEGLAFAKASEVADFVEDALIISADTIIVFDDKMLGKPKDKEDAFQMLKKLSNNKHQVYTGLAVILTDDQKHYVGHDMTEVFMREIDDKEIESYINTGEPMDKAGSYGIQGKGGIFVEKIIGSFFTVMGLPIHQLSTVLKNFNIELL